MFQRTAHRVATPSLKIPLDDPLLDTMHLHPKIEQNLPLGLVDVRG